MKKLLCVLLVLAMCLPYANLAFADDGSEVADLIISAKQRFQIDDNLFVFDRYNKDDYGDEVMYYLSWKSRTEDEYSYSPTISVRVENDGDVEYYRLSKRYTDSLVIPSVTEEQLLEKATELITVIAPERMKKVDGGKVSDIASGTVMFERLENGIPVSGDYISVQLDIQTLELICYNAHWTEATFPSPENIIDTDKAQEEYKSKLGYELLYNIVTEKMSIKEIYLSYAPKAANAYIDAFSGEAKIHSGYAYTTAGAMTADMAVEESANLKALSPEEQALVDEVNKMITKEDAEKIVRAIEEFSIRDDADVSGFSVSKNRYGDYVANITLSVNKKDDYYYASATINAKTKEILSFRESENHKETGKKYDAEKAKANALSFLKKYYADKFSEAQSEFTLGKADEYSFNFDRYVNNIKVKNNGLSISANPYTGEISSFNCNWANADFPSAKNVLDIDAIYENVLSDKNFGLRYLVTEVYEYSDKTGKETRRTETNLAYMPQSTPVYGGESGGEIDYQGNPVAQAFKGYDDIKGHYCETAAVNLAKAGIYFEGGSLKPNENATQAEFLKLILRAINGYLYENDDDIYRYCISEEIMAEDEIGKPLTRADAVRFIINAIGFKDAAEIKGIYKCSFEDVADDFKGYVAIAGGLGIINTSPSIFRTNDIMTRAECVTMIHNYLK